MRILFLGNSFTYYHDLPDMVAELLHAEVKGNLCGGAYLYQHIDPSDELCTINTVFPDVCVMPYVVTGGTDTRFYGEVCDSCVRFSPVLYGPEQMAGMHGLNENIEANCLPPAVDYYKAIIKAQEQR